MGRRGGSKAVWGYSEKSSKMGNPTNFVIGKKLYISEYCIVRSHSEFMNHYAYSEKLSILYILKMFGNYLNNISGE